MLRQGLRTTADLRGAAAPTGERASETGEERNVRGVAAD